MKKIYVLFLISLLSYTCDAQVRDTLTFNRRVFKTELILNNQVLSNNEMKERFKIEPAAVSKYKSSKVLLGMSPFLVAGGAYLAVDGLIGTKVSTFINGQSYEYKDRSLSKLLLGLGLFVTGGAFMEGSNDLMVSAAKRYNTKLKKNVKATKTAYLPKIGITEQGNVGFRIEF